MCCRAKEKSYQFSTNNMLRRKQNTKPPMQQHAVARHLLLPYTTKIIDRTLFEELRKSI
jgi:hypothetical protein